MNFTAPELIFPALLILKTTGQSLTALSACLYICCIWTLALPKQQALQTNSWGHLKQGYWLHVCLLRPVSFSFTHLCSCVGVISPPPLSPACRSGKQVVSGHSRERQTGLCCSPPWTLTCLWQYSIITLPSCWRSSALSPGILGCRPAGVSPRPHHAADQISSAGRGVAAVLLHHHRPQLHLRWHRYGVVVFQLSYAQFLIPYMSFLVFP